MTTASAASPCVLGVHCGAARPLPVGGRQVLSSIAKQPVAGRCAVRRLGLEGDEQADLSVHGGLEKAVHAYPVEHAPFWQALLGDRGEVEPLRSGGLGENLSIAGVLEADMYVGDTWQFPDCVLRVSLPRIPCAKLNAALRHPRAARHMAESGRCGTYLAVVTPGTIEAGEAFTVVPGPRDVTLLSLFGVSRTKTRHD
ncbi:MAG: MOSC domain-containing protein [Pseudomonadota bacterium]